MFVALRVVFVAESTEAGVSSRWCVVSAAIDGVTVVAGRSASLGAPLARLGAPLARFCVFLLGVLPGGEGVLQLPVADTVGAANGVVLALRVAAAGADISTRVSTTGFLVLTKQPATATGLVLAPVVSLAEAGRGCAALAVLARLRMLASFGLGHQRPALGWRRFLRLGRLRDG